jgi:predicted neuraminidase
MRHAGVRWVLGLAAIVLNSLPWLWPGARSAPPSPTFILPSPASQPDPLPFYRAELIEPDSRMPMSHVASICELVDGGLAAVWYAGTREGARDVAIYFATQRPGSPTWSRPQAILTPAIAARDLGRNVKKVGNPVIFSDGTDKLWLLYVTIDLGGWSGSSLNLTTSTNGGYSWSPSRRLTLSPFFNISELARNRPLHLSDASWLAPIYHEMAGKFPEVLRLRETPTGFAVTKTRICGGRSTLQPSLTPLTTNSAFAFLRDAGPQRKLSIARTDDAGQTWSSPAALDLPNPDAGLSTLPLPGGRILLAFNDSPTGRGNLRLAISDDLGRTWKRLAWLENEPGAEFSYPYLLQTRDGKIHLVYTWKRKGIKHVVFNEAWLNSPPGNTPK